MTKLAPRIIDISFPLDATTYRNNLPKSLVDGRQGMPIGFEIETVIERGGDFSVGQVARGIKMRLHAGSHIDAPEHWIEGALQIQDFPLDRFIGDAFIADLTGRPNREITRDELGQAVGQGFQSGDRLLIRTDWNDRLMEMDFEDWKLGSPYLTSGALEWCVTRKPAIVGIDFYHGTRAPGTEHSDGFEGRLARGGVLTLTNLINLKSARHHRVTLIALPLALHGVEAAPVRAIILEDDI
jgi:arylformamidase